MMHYSKLLLFVILLSLYTLSLQNIHSEKRSILINEILKNKISNDKTFFTYGVWYGGGKYRAPMMSRDPKSEREAWKKDLQTIKSLGFNSVKTWIDWATTEPKEGQFNLEGLKQYLELASEVGLRVVIQVYADSAPEWVGKKFPGAEFVTSTGIKIISQSAPGHCIDHAGVRDAEMNFYRKIAQTAMNSNATYGYDVWSEPHIVNWVWFTDMPNVKFCYCKHTQARFRNWLKAKYGTLERLNLAWYRTFESWEDVEAPRFGTILSHADFMDWMSFTTDKLAQDMHSKAEAVKSVDGKHITTSHSAAPSVSTSPFDDHGVPDDWKMSNVKSVDFYGSSYYPKHAMSPLGGRPAGERSFLYAGAYSASKQKGFFVGELQAGQGVTGMRVNEPTTAEDQRDWVWSLIANGAKSIFFFAYYPMNAGYESNGYGLINLDGTLTDRAISSGRIGHVISKYGPLFMHAMPEPAQFAILFNPLTHLTGGYTIGPGAKYRSDLVGTYKSIFPKNINVAFIHSDEVEAGMLSKFKAVYLPFAITVTRKASAAIEEYVKQGGIAISEARLAWNDELGHANERIPGAGLDQVFGVHETALSVVETKIVLLENHTIPGLPSGLSFPTQVFQESLQVNRGKVHGVFEDGRPAIVESTYGKGKTLFIGTFAGVAVEDAKSEEAAKFIGALPKWAGILPTVVVAGDDKEAVEARVMIVPGTSSYLLIAINRGQDGNFLLETRLRFTKARNLINEENLPVVDSSKVRVSIKKGDAICLLLE